IRYQLTHVDMAGKKVLSPWSFPEVGRLGNNVQPYTFLPLHVHSNFRIIDPVAAGLDLSVSWRSPDAATDHFFVTRLIAALAPLRAIVAALACYSILIAILLGFTGGGDGFKRANPVMFERLSGWFK